MVRDFRLMKAAILAGLCVASIAVLWLYANPRDATPPVAPESPIESGGSARLLGPSASETAMTKADARAEPETPAAATMGAESPSPTSEWARGLNGFRNPSQQLLSVDCRTTVCRIVIYGEGEKYLNGGPPIHRLRELGLDHQGPADLVDEGNAYSYVLIVRRMR